ncbi:MAG: nucleotidyltransferase domain-containing protein [Bacteroidetes bacterium]|nr:MAG: nucleotidyltransferase domain-containing protein [Bacteroidota bacterium]REK07242.1 MAG: nucleotidyltransferase domain-containing protein [Bacteroidota bacterium]REK31771.1 MAG: nucleotidyltransferase domain-containing protein [Bacteroidota bacterium]REK48049.1 MAG: nucleotidyltransferase domain-containing protein [Bacteroidota bacterium]
MILQRKLLTAYFSGARFGPLDGILSLAHPLLPFKRHTREVIDEWKSLQSGELCGQEQEVVIPVYEGKNPHLLAIMSGLKSLESELAGAYVHGSIALGEEIAYSDFDGLIIIKDQVFEEPSRLARLAMQINRLGAVMYRIDPLQHHGWFIMTENDMECYPENYLPSAVLAQSKSLLQNKGINVKYRVPEYIDFFSGLKSACRRIRKMKTPENQPANLFQLKSILSEFMMLPVLYVQARDQKGIHKKYSFQIAAADFSEREWKVMDEVSQIRQSWKQEFSPSMLNRLQKNGYFWMMYKKKFGPGIPEELRNIIDQRFYERMAEFANRIEMRLFRSV